jgi:hypothetical protein
MCACGILSFIFLLYNGNLIAYHYLWLALSLLGTYIGWRIFDTAGDDEINKYISARQERIKTLNENGTKITVDLSKCKVLSQGYTKEEPSSISSRAQGFNAMLDSENATQSIEVNNSVVMYYNGKQKFVSETFQKDSATLQFQIAAAKSTYIYLDEQNGDYYFDLSFLDQ